VSIDNRIQQLIEETQLQYSNSPFNLREEIKRGNDIIRKKDKVLGSIKELEKRIKALKKLKDDKKVRAAKQELKKQINITNSSQYYEYGLIDTETLQGLLNTKKLKQIGSGYTSIVFNDPIKKGKVLVFTLDESKVKWMQANKQLFDFQMIDTIPYTAGNILYIYSVEKLTKTYANKKMSTKKRQMIYDDVINKYMYLKSRKGFNSTTVNDLDYIITGIDNIELKNILEKLKDTFGNSEILDLHGGQWGENKAGKIILFDPIISSKAINSVDELNDLDLKTQFSFMLDGVLARTNSAYLKKIMNFLKKK